MAIITLNPIYDTYNDGSEPTSNFYTETSIWVQDYYDPIIDRIYMQFNIASLAGITIDTATLSLYAHEGDATLYVKAVSIDEAWNETTLNWDNRPNIQSDFNGTEVEQTSTTGWINFDIKDLVVGWQAETIENNGVCLRQTVSEAYRGFYSKDYTTDTTLRPKLVIAYTSSDQTVTAPLGTATGEGLQTTTAINVPVTAPLGTATAEGLQTTTSINVPITAPLGVATGTGLIPTTTLSITATVTAPLGTAIGTGLTPTTTPNIPVTAPLGMGTAEGLQTNTGITAAATVTAPLGAAMAEGLQTTTYISDIYTAAAPLGTGTAEGLQTITEACSDTTIIVVKTPLGAVTTLPAYEKCTVTVSSKDNSGSFSVEMKDFDSDLIDSFVFGSDVRIFQDGHYFRGWITQPGKAISGQVRMISFSGLDYTAKTQKILVTETYTAQTISYIVNDLCTIYTPWATRVNIETCSTVLTVVFNDKFLWETIEQLCTISGYQFYIDEYLDAHFFQPASRISAYSLATSTLTYRKGSAKLSFNCSKIVNKLWVKGSKALSDNFTQALTVGVNPIPLLYTPRASTTGITVTIGGVVKTLGIQNVTKAATVDFLLNFAEKLLIPDLCVTGTGTIVYKYEYPIKILLEDPASQDLYGVFEDVYTVDTEDRTIALLMGQKYLEQYAYPVVSGSIEPLANLYNPGEMVYITIPNLNIDGYLQITSVTYDSKNQIAKVYRTLQIESQERDLASILKKLNSRVTKLESTAEVESAIDRYISQAESTGWLETIDMYIPYIVDYCDDKLFCEGVHSA